MSRSATALSMADGPQPGGRPRRQPRQAPDGGALKLRKINIEILAETYKAFRLAAIQNDISFAEAVDRAARIAIGPGGNFVDSPGGS